MADPKKANGKAPAYPDPPKGHSVLGPFQENPIDTGNTFQSDVQRIVKIATEPGYVAPNVGDFHPDTQNFPDHQLIIPPIAEADGKTVTHIYAILRDSIDQEVFEEWGGGIASTLRSFAFSQLNADEGFLVIKSAVEDLNDGRFRKDTTQLSELGLPSVALTNGGSGYTSAPTVAFSGGTGSGGALTARLGIPVASVTVNSGGTNYGYPPAVYAVGDGYGFVGIAIINGSGHVTGVTVIKGGSWNSAPSILFLDDGGGSNASATAVMAGSGPIDSLVVSDFGNYTVAPSVVFTGGGGSNAAATYTVPQAEWPELVGVHTDPVYGIVVDLTKKVVRARTPYPGGFTDIDPIERWRSIQITSKVDLRTLPAPITYAGVHQLDLPPLLVDVVANWGLSGGVTEDVEYASALKQGGVIVTAKASVEVSDAVMGSIEVLVKHGYRGPALAEVTRMFFFGPPGLNQIPNITRIIPVTGTASLIGKNVTFSQARGTGDDLASGTHGMYPSALDKNQGELRTQTINFGPILSNNFTNINQTQVGSGADASVTTQPDGNMDPWSATLILPGVTGTLHVNIPTSDPVTLTSGQWLLMDAIPEEWRFGLFVVHLIWVQIP